MSTPAARVLLVGFQDQDNLGLRYLASSLRAAGHDVRIESFGPDAAPLVTVARSWAPDVIGFSMIFQFMAPEFGQVIGSLRAAGVDAHCDDGWPLRLVCAGDAARSSSPSWTASSVSRGRTQSSS